MSEDTITITIPTSVWASALLSRPIGPRRFDIALCGKGCVGLVLSTAPEPVVYDDGSEGLAWTGIHLRYDAKLGIVPGNQWSSRSPTVIGNLLTMLAESQNKETA